MQRQQAALVEHCGKFEMEGRCEVKGQAVLFRRRKCPNLDV
jgi:hypothetical protein